jgi:hypothetical protein
MTHNQDELESLYGATAFRVEERLVDFVNKMVGEGSRLPQ